MLAAGKDFHRTFCQCHVFVEDGFFVFMFTFMFVLVRRNRNEIRLAVRL